MRQRTRACALRVVKLATSLPRNRIADVFARQLVRAGTGVAANYRAACRARSYAEFTAKIGTVEEEADETVFWIELAVEAGLAKRQRVSDLAAEAKEILAIITASRKTAKKRRSRRNVQRRAGRGDTRQSAI
jgi:four helix bundle protein